MTNKERSATPAETTVGPALKVRPRVWIGLVIWAGYALLVFLVQLITSVPYSALGDSGSNLFFGAGLSLIVGAVALVITATLLGWWRPALFDRHRSVRWPIFVPILMVVALIINLMNTDWGSYDGGFFAASLVLLLVGFTEEMATRGLLIVGLRSRLGEGWVWFLSSALFALMHLMNALTGQDLLTTLQQVGMAFIAGTIFYILRRTTGSLIWAMVLHGLWDFSVFAVEHGTPGKYAALGTPVYAITGLAALAVVAFVIRGAKERTAIA
ncbi:CPBP family intramembrane glutamic endopeptidase [Microbacterium sp. NPDC057650]|uniref:CPBP family intramembrane glutamic endopeptidase n=1 Tax=unclassified Microbacterium TaxID=2609290 RepID=UPI003673605A